MFRMIVYHLTRYIDHKVVEYPNLLLKTFSTTVILNTTMNVTTTTTKMTMIFFFNFLFSLFLLQQFLKNHQFQTNYKKNHHFFAKNWKYHHFWPKLKKSPFFSKIWKIINFGQILKNYYFFPKSHQFWTNFEKKLSLFAKIWIIWKISLSFLLLSLSHSFVIFTNMTTNTTTMDTLGMDLSHGSARIGSVRA